MHALDVAAIGALAGKRAAPFATARNCRSARTAAIRMLHTPGHTDGSSCFLYPLPIDGVFTGDTLFAGSVGGAFGDASTYADILDSVRRSSSRLPDETRRHARPRTAHRRIALERAHNPFF